MYIEIERTLCRHFIIVIADRPLQLYMSQCSASSTASSI